MIEFLCDMQSCHSLLSRGLAGLFIRLRTDDCADRFEQFQTQVVRCQIMLGVLQRHCPGRIHDELPAFTFSDAREGLWTTAGANWLPAQRCTRRRSWLPGTGHHTLLQIAGGQVGSAGSGQQNRSVHHGRRILEEVRALFFHNRDKRLHRFRIEMRPEQRVISSTTSLKFRRGR